MPKASTTGIMVAGSVASQAANLHSQHLNVSSAHPTPPAALNVAVPSSTENVEYLARFFNQRMGSILLRPGEARACSEVIGHSRVDDVEGLRRLLGVFS